MGLFEVKKWEPTETIAPDWNVAPTKDVYAVLDRPVRDSGSPEPVRQLRVLRWGLVPSWAKTPDGGARLINARAETAHEKPSFRRALTARRCLIPADGYYEWLTGSQERQLEEQGKKKRSRKQPYFVTPADGSVFAMAGLYEFWRDATLPDDHPRAWWTTCTVVTTAAETTDLAGYDGHGPRSLADIHPRMPLMLPRTGGRPGSIRPPPTRTPSTTSSRRRPAGCCGPTRSAPRSAACRTTAQSC